MSIEKRPRLDVDDKDARSVKILFEDFLFGEKTPIRQEVCFLAYSGAAVGRSGVLARSWCEAKDGTSETSHCVGRSFREKLISLLRSPLTGLDVARLLDAEATTWFWWDSSFASSVPLTSERQFCDGLCMSIEAIRIAVKCVSETPKGTAPSQQRDASSLGLVQRATTFLGSVGLLMAPGSKASDAASGPRVRIFLVRHGESTANIDPQVYDTTPDHAIPLTARGHSMAAGAGRFLRQLLTEQHETKEKLGHHVRMLVSPYKRTRETAQEILRELNGVAEGCKWVDSVKELAYLAEQDFGLCEGEGQAAKTKYLEVLDRITLQRLHRGKFWSRFPQGESPFDVAVRMNGVFSEIMSGCTVSTSTRGVIQTFVLVSHGVTIRAFLSAWCGRSPEWMSDSINPPNCSVQMIEDTEWRGYVFGGYDGDSAVDAATVDVMVDPQEGYWQKWL